jgi:hypothetical protein
VTTVLSTRSPQVPSPEGVLVHREARLGIAACQVVHGEKVQSAACLADFRSRSSLYRRRARTGPGTPFLETRETATPAPRVTQPDPR